jgi:hypothetical protein
LARRHGLCDLGIENPLAFSGFGGRLGRGNPAESFLLHLATFFLSSQFFLSEPLFLCLFVCPGGDACR